MERHVFADDRVYRREGFGGIVYSRTSKDTRFYNHAAALVIESFLRPRSLDENSDAERALGADAVRTFFARLVADGTLRPVGRSGAPGAAFFTDCTDFTDGRVRAPIAVELELTPRPRSGTGGASESRPGVDATHDLSREAYRALFERFARAGVLYLRFTGGDPLARPDCLDIAGDADSNQFGIAIASDLTAFEPWHAERLAALENLVCLHTSLDGPTPEIADRLRGTGSYRQVTAALDAFTASGVPVVVETVLSRHNADHIYEMARLLACWPVSWCLSPLGPAGRGRDGDDLVPDEAHLASAGEQFARAVDQKLVRPADPTWGALAAAPSADPRAAPSADPRAALWRSQPWLTRCPERVLRIDPSGRCYTSVRVGDVLHRDVYVGSAVESDLITLWNGALLDEERASPVLNSYLGDVVDIQSLVQHAVEGGEAWAR